MKAIITRDAVADTIKKLNEAGQKPTLAAIHAALGGKGSLTTLIKLKAEIEQATSAPQDSAEGLTQFRSLWAAAVAEGRKMMETQMSELRAALEALTVENERLEAAAIADAARVAEIQAKLDKLVDEVSLANRAATEARAGAADASGKLAAALADVAQIRAEYLHSVTTAAKDLAAARDQAHALAVERATLLERIASSERGLSNEKAMADRLSGQLEKAVTKIETGEIELAKVRNLAAERFAELEAARKEIKRLTQPTKPRTPKA